MLLGLAANLWGTSDGSLEKVKEEVNPGTMNVRLVEFTLQMCEKFWVERNE